eukprot:1139010-Pelagomonas_calceolata.AAC.8
MPCSSWSNREVLASYCCSGLAKEVERSHLNACGTRMITLDSFVRLPMLQAGHPGNIQGLLEKKLEGKYLLASVKRPDTYCCSYFRNLLIAGAVAQTGAPMEQVVEAARKASAACGTMGVALRVCTLPGKPPSDRIKEGEMEVGLGIHGEGRCILLLAIPPDHRRG